MRIGTALGLKKKSNSSGGSRSKRNTKWIIVSVALISVLAAGAVSAVTFSSNNSTANRNNELEFGALGSAHDHAAFLVVIDGKRIDFAPSKYQLKSQYIHVENLIGTTLHKHAIFVPVGEFFKSVGMEVKNNCFVSDDGKQYCNSDTKKLRFFVNGLERNPQSIMDYIVQDDDRFLLIYGDENQQAIAAVLEELSKIRIFRT